MNKYDYLIRIKKIISISILEYNKKFFLIINNFLSFHYNNHFIKNMRQKSRTVHEGV